MDTTTPTRPPMRGRRLYVPIPGHELEALFRRARQADRKPQAEAARIIRERLVQDGDIPDQDTIR